MIDIRDLKSNISEDDIKNIMDDLDISLVKENTKELIYMTGCHNEDCELGSPKLYYYKESQMFHCYTCDFNGDIIALIEKRWQTINKSFSFMDILNYIIKIVKYKAGENKREFDSNKFFNRFKTNTIERKSIEIYDSPVLNGFDTYYPQMLLKDHITKETMDKYQIKYYTPRSQILFPVFNIKGELVGIQARNTNKELIEKGYKYIPLKTLSTEYNFPTSQCLYGLFYNYKNIQETKEVNIFEAAKSILQLDSYVKCNNSVAIFGVNMSRDKLYQILQLGINKVNICLDKQYREIGDNDFKKWARWVKKIYLLFKPYCEVYVVYDKENLLDFKDSPTDKGVDIWNELYYNRVKLR